VAKTAKRFGNVEQSLRRVRHNKLYMRKSVSVVDVNLLLMSAGQGARRGKNGEALWQRGAEPLLWSQKLS